MSQLGFQATCHDSTVGMDYFSFRYLSLPPLFPLRRVPLC